MKNLLSQLQGNEAILLMYLAGELSAEDRVVVDQLLKVDGAMNAQLRELAESVETVKRAANAGRADLNVERSIRQTVAAMRRWQGESARRPALAKAEASRLLLPWWCYPLAAAASIVLAAAVFFANMEPTPPGPTGGTAQSVPVQDMVLTQGFSGLSLDPIEAHAVADELVATFDDTGFMYTEAGDRGLLAATRDMESLHESSQASLGTLDVTVQ